MTAPTIYDCEQRSVEWYEARRGIVTASVVGKLITPTLKVASNDTSRGVIATLATERITGVVEDTYTSHDMLLGILNEPLAREHYAKHHAPVAEVGFMVRDFGDYKIGASPDGLVGDDGLIEIKSRKPQLHILDTLADVVPVAHMAQIQCQLLVSGRTWCDFVSYSGGLPLFVKRVKADPDWYLAIINAVNEAEAEIQKLVDAYRAATKDQPATERVEHFPEIEV